MARSGQCIVCGQHVREAKVEEDCHAVLVQGIPMSSHQYVHLHRLHVCLKRGGEGGRTCVGAKGTAYVAWGSYPTKTLEL
jgi:hypothetical protein